MKKFIFVFVILFSVLFFFVACSANKNEAKTFKIISTIFPYYDFTRHITKGVDGVHVDMLISPGTDYHSFEPTPQKIKEIKTAGLFIYNGGENDIWVKKILNSLENKKDFVMPISDIFSAGEKVKDKHIHEEHFWTSILNCMEIVDKIKNKLCSLNPKNSLKYEENTKKYLDDLKKLHEDFLYVVKNKKRDILVFGDRFPFTYFVRDYNLRYISPYSGCSSKTGVSALKVSEIIDRVKKIGVPLILKSEQTGDNISSVIADGVGAKVKRFYSCHNCSVEDFKKGMTFLDFYRKNIETLKEALW